MNENIDTNKILKLFKIIIKIAPVILIIWIVNQHLILNGVFEIKYDVTKKSKLVNNFASKENDKLIGSLNLPGYEADFQLITTSPVYFDVKVPKPFQKATISLKYQNPDNQPVIKLGVKQANEAYYYKDLALSLTELENMPDYWHKIQEGDMVLWQKDIGYYNDYKQRKVEFDNKWKQKLRDEYGALSFDKLDSDKKELFFQRQYADKEYQSELEDVLKESKDKESDKLEFNTIDEFTNKMPDIDKIIQYNYPVISGEELTNYEISNDILEINKSFRGSHELLIYIGKDEQLNFTFTIQDINRNKGTDDFSVLAYNMLGEKVGEAKSADDGIEDANGLIRPERKVDLEISNLKFGAYRLVINSPNDEIFVKNIKTTQHLLMFKQKIFLTDNKEYEIILNDKALTPTTLFTNSNSINARTSHISGLQTLKVGWQNLEIDAKNINSKIDIINENVTEIISPLNDVLIEGNGFFAFSIDQMFDSEAVMAKSADQVDDINDYNYVIANYPQAEQEGDWLVAETSIEVPNLYFDETDDTNVSFIFSLPGLPENNRKLKINEVNIKFEKEPITFKNFFSKLNNWLKRKN